MGTDAQRAKLYTTVADNWGEEAAEAMMAVLPPWDHAEVARKSDIDNVRTEFVARFDKLDAKIDAQFVRLVAFFLPLMIALAGLALAAAKIA